MKKITPIFITFFLLGCTSTEQAMRRANARFVGRSIDEFVLEHGIPYAKHQLNNGGYIYAWNSGVISYNMPETTIVTGQIDPLVFYSRSPTTTGGGSIDICCEVQIHTSAEGKILSIKPIRDTWGRWTTSRCSEIFKKTRRTPVSKSKSLVTEKTHRSIEQDIVYLNDSNATTRKIIKYRMK